MGEIMYITQELANIIGEERKKAKKLGYLMALQDISDHIEQEMKVCSADAFEGYEEMQEYVLNKIEENNKEEKNDGTRIS